MNKYIGLLFLMLIFFVNIVSSQDDFITQPISTGDIFVLANEGYPNHISQIWHVDPLENTSELFVDFNTSEFIVSFVQFASPPNLYLLEIDDQQNENTGLFPLGYSRIVKYNSLNSERETIFSGENIVKFYLSPSNSKILIEKFPEVLTSITRDTIGQKELCVVTLTDADSSCQLINLPLNYVFEPIWISTENIILVAQSRTSLILLNSDTLEQSVIELPEENYVVSLDAFSFGTNLIVHAASTTGSSDTLLSLSTQDFEINQIALLPRLVNPIGIAVSPNNTNVVVYGREQAYLVRLSDGMVLREYPIMYGLNWQSFYWIDSENTQFVIAQLGYDASVVLNLVLEPLSAQTVSIIDTMHGRFARVP